MSKHYGVTLPLSVIAFLPQVWIFVVINEEAGKIQSEGHLGKNYNSVHVPLGHEMQ